MKYALNRTLSALLSQNLVQLCLFASTERQKTNTW